MASLLQMGCSALIYTNALVKTIHGRPQSCTAVARTVSSNGSPVLPRRSANYKPSLWDHHHLISMENKYANDKIVQKRDSIKEKVREMIDDAERTYLEKLELIDDLQKLGVSYHFELEIDKILTHNYHKDRRIFRNDMGKDLYATALEFQLFRQHSLHVSENVFDVFVNNCGEFEGYNIHALISVYEASYLSTKSDTKLQKIIRPFATQQLKNFVETHSNKDSRSHELRAMVVQALDMPYYWQMKRLATRWHIDMYGKRHDKDQFLVEFSKIDFNIVQACHQEELKYVSTWWKETGLGDQLHFARDRIVENYFWTIGHIQEPQFGYVRRMMTKVNAFITTCDDIYDVFGTLEELELLTAAFENWDVNRLDDLPEYLTLFFLVVYNEVNSIGCDILRNKNINVIPFLKKSWADLSKAYLLEAKWYKTGHKPKLEEYMQNAWISISAPLIILHFYCLFSDQLSVQVLESLSQYQQKIVQYSSYVFRLANDLATSPDELARGDVYKSIQCYMNETGASEEEARSHLRQMMYDMWDKMNYEKIVESSLLLPRDFVETVMNLVRMSQCMYQYGDGHGSPEKARIVDRVMSLLFNPVPLD